MPAVSSMVVSDPVHTYPPHLVAESGNFRKQSPEWKCFNSIRIRTRLDNCGRRYTKLFFNYPNGKLLDPIFPGWDSKHFRFFIRQKISILKDFNLSTYSLKKVVNYELVLRYNLVFCCCLFHVKYQFNVLVSPLERFDAFRVGFSWFMTLFLKQSLESFLSIRIHVDMVSEKP